MSCSLVFLIHVPLLKTSVSSISLILEIGIFVFQGYSELEKSLHIYCFGYLLAKKGQILILDTRIPPTSFFQFYETTLSLPLPLFFSSERFINRNVHRSAC